MLQLQPGRQGRSRSRLLFSLIRVGLSIETVPSAVQDEEGDGCVSEHFAHGRNDFTVEQPVELLRRRRIRDYFAPPSLWRGR